MFTKANKGFLAWITPFIGLPIRSGLAHPRWGKSGSVLGLSLLGVMSVLACSPVISLSDTAGFAPVTIATATATKAPAHVTIATPPAPPQSAVTEPQNQSAEEAARRELDALYKGDYRQAFVEKKPELFLKHIPDDFSSVAVDGTQFDAAALRQFFPQQFTSMVRTVEHNVTIEDVDLLPDGTISAVVTLYTLIEYQGKGDGHYLVTTIGTYRDEWQQRDGMWYEVQGNQLRNQTLTAPRP